MSFKFYARSGHGIILGTTMCLEGLKTTKNPSEVSGSQRRGLNTVPPENETRVLALGRDVKSENTYLRSNNNWRQNLARHKIKKL
jgi:hypothetical protein